MGMHGIMYTDFRMPVYSRKRGISMRKGGALIVLSLFIK